MTAHYIWKIKYKREKKEKKEQNTGSLFYIELASLF